MNELFAVSVGQRFSREQKGMRLFGLLFITFLVQLRYLLIVSTFTTYVE